MANPPRDQHVPTAGKPLFSTSFTLADLARIRDEVAAVSRRCGLGHDEIEDWVTAVNELLINVIRHGGGKGAVRLLLNGQLTCEVTTRGGASTPRTTFPASSDRRCPTAEGWGCGWSGRWPTTCSSTADPRVPPSASRHAPATLSASRALLRR
ncbi:ATP-binding protein [Micromonospora sp. STR1s_6]|uniref:ATP-binding protein n=1 Tax=Micromonospora tarensis TaxID=2806100 RepID=A0ABS1YDE7_9ACTN|nr:ATP-binding protein [Micromonospora tarensis]